MFETPYDQAWNEMNNILKRGNGHCCPLCGTYLAYNSDVKMKWLDTLTVELMPAGHELEYLDAQYEYCPHCGFATDNLDRDDLDNLDYYEYQEVQEAIQQAFSAAKTTTELSLLLGVIRYYCAPKAWAHLICYYREIGEQKRLYALKNDYLEARQEFDSYISENPINPQMAISRALYAQYISLVGATETAKELLSKFSRVITRKTLRPMDVNRYYKIIRLTEEQIYGAISSF